MDDILINLVDISKTFPGVKALDRVNMQIRKGEVHALVGENGAGKSTLIKILTGAYSKDTGKIYISGEEVNVNSPQKAIELGIACIYQELNQVPMLSIYENIFLGNEKMNGRFLNKLYMIQEAKKVLSNVGLSNIDPDTPIEKLGMGKRQMVEIAKALTRNAKLIIMDEPTSSLSQTEVENLFNVIRSLKDIGISVLYVSHRLEEIFEICDTVTVLRDGKHISTLNVSDTTIEDLIKLMVGRTLEEKFPKIDANIGIESMRVRNLTRRGVFENINFELNEGEILGFAGLVGAGRTEVMRSIFGADPKDEGEIYIYKKLVVINKPEDAIKQGIAFLTEDRKGEGLNLLDSVMFNIVQASIIKYKSGLGLLSLPNIKNTVSDYVEELNIKTPSITKLVGELSGGNQQKVVIAKWLDSNAKIFIFDEPTRGIDVGAKIEVYNIMNSLIKAGKSIIMVSSELPEILGMSDRIVVMCEGRITATLTKGEADQEKIMKAATGGIK